jgi:hypothetical protein
MKLRHGVCDGRLGSCRVAVGGLTMTQVDPKVLEELPPDVVEELRAGLPPSHAPFAKQGNLSPDASQGDPPSAAGGLVHAQSLLHADQPHHMPHSRPKVGHSPLCQILPRGNIFLLLMLLYPSSLPEELKSHLRNVALLDYACYFCTSFAGNQSVLQ